MVLDTLLPDLQTLGPVRLERPEYALRGVHLDVTLSPETLRPFAQALRARGFLIEDVTCVDAAPERMAVYHFAHVDEAPCRVVGRVVLPREVPEVPSIQDIFPGANWHERETHEFFGLAFAGHPDLSHLILPDDAGDLTPLRKADDAVKALGALLPEFAPPAPEGGGPAEGEAKPRPVRKEKPASAEGEA